MEEQNVITKEIGERIEQQRIKKGLSQTDLALSMGYKSSSTIRKWEVGENIPSGLKLIELVKKLGTSTDYILLGLENTNVNNNNVNGDKNNVATMSGDINGNVSFGSTIQKEDLHEVASNLNLTDRELQEKTLSEVSDLRASQARLESAISLLMENQANVLASMKSVDETFEKMFMEMLKELKK